MSSSKITVTKNYRLFKRSDNNRPVDVKKHRKLEASLKEYGYLKSFPIVCSRDANGDLIVKDGQHRLLIAESLGLAVAYVVESVDFDIATINCTSKVWQIRDYALTHAANGKKDYQEGIDFADEHKLPIGIAFAMLAGTISFTNVQAEFIDGTFRIKDRTWAGKVASIYTPIVNLAPSAMRNARFLDACMAVCRVKEFEAERLIHGAEKCRDKLVSYSTKDAYLTLCEELYNFKRQKLVGLKMAATMAMRERNACNAAKKAKASKAKTKATA
jgi:hypothetical protein